MLVAAGNNSHPHHITIKYSNECLMGFGQWDSSILLWLIGSESGKAQPNFEPLSIQNEDVTQGFIKFRCFLYLTLENDR